LTIQSIQRSALVPITEARSMSQLLRIMTF